MSTFQPWHVCGLVIQADPKSLFFVMETLRKIPYTEIPTFDSVTGKIVVVLQSECEQQLLDNMKNAQEIAGVLAISLVYHQQDMGE